MTGTRAAVDCGTNSTRLLVVDGEGRRLFREMRITRLGAGVDERGHLDDDALRRTLDTIRDYRQIWESHGVPAARVRIAATSAVRDADDRDRFFDGVREVAGVEAEVITGEEEARLTFLGATSAVDVTYPVAVMDIGGGSTELVVGDAEGDLTAAHSMQLGSVRLTERILRDDPPTEEQVTAARREISERLDEADDVLARGGARIGDAATLIAVAGTPTTMAALHLGLDAYEEERIHATVMPRASVAAITADLLGKRVAERAELGPIQAGREDVIAGGALILLAVMERYGFESVIVSEADILNGLAATVAA